MTRGGGALYICGQKKMKHSFCGFGGGEGKWGGVWEVSKPAHPTLGSEQKTERP